MDVDASLTAPCPPEVLFGHVDDLESYTRWIDLVHRAVRLADDAGRPCWDVELRARIGPFARSKRLRMVRAVHSPERGIVVFERSETDGREHSPWVLSATVVPDSEGARLDMNLHYGGGLWTGGVLERALGDQISDGRERLRRLVSATH